MAVRAVIPGAEANPILRVPVVSLVNPPLPVRDVLTVTKPEFVTTAGDVTVSVPTVNPPEPEVVNAAAVLNVRFVIDIAVVEASAPFKVLIVTVPVMETVPRVFVMPEPMIIAVLAPFKVPEPLRVTIPVRVLLPVLLSRVSVPFVMEVVESTVKTELV